MVSSIAVVLTLQSLSSGSTRRRRDACDTRPYFTMVFVRSYPVLSKVDLTVMYITLARHEGPMVSGALDASTIDSASTTAYQIQDNARLTVIQVSNRSDRSRARFPFQADGF